VSAKKWACIVCGSAGDCFSQCPEAGSPRDYVLVLNAGHRERQALLHWWSVLSDEVEPRREQGFVDFSDGRAPLSPFWRALELAVYDPRTDSISWRGENKLIENINNMQRRH
jgi:hypothetical protein